MAARTYVDPLARIEAGAAVGHGSRLWANAHVRAGARIGIECSVGENVFIDHDVVVGDRCKIQNNALLYFGVELGNGVFVGPGVTLTNDRYPRAIMPSGDLKTDVDWQVAGIKVGRGAALGALCVVVAGITIGEWALVGAGSVVTADVDAHSIVVGNPARQIGRACFCGRPFSDPICTRCRYPELGTTGSEG